jgi:hypothetical protein
MRNALLYVTMLLFWVCGCGHGEKPENKDDGRNEVELYEKWLVYDRPIDGYDVMIHWSCDKAQLFTGTGIFYFSNADTTKTLTQSIDLDGWFDEKMLKESPDTIILDHYYDDAMQPYLDWRVIVGFADYDFDGENELVICGSPSPCRSLDANEWLDCEDFTFYKGSPKGFVRMGEEPFDILSTETCRMFCKFDASRKTILLLTSGGACCSDSTTYYFQDGLPYKSVAVRHERLADTTINETIVLHYSYD